MEEREYIPFKVNSSVYVKKKKSVVLPHSASPSEDAIAQMLRKQGREERGL